MHRNRFCGGGPRLAGAAMALFLSLTALAQEGSYWNEYPLPGPLLSIPNNGASKVVASGTNVTIITSTDVHMYSGIRRSWTVVPISPSATVYSRYNEHVLIKDGAQVTAWSTRSDTLQTITVSPAAVINPGVEGRGWTASVTDGSTVYVFASFSGNWTTIATASPTPTVSLSNHIAVVEDGSNIWAVSAYYGQAIVAPAGTVQIVQENLVVTQDATNLCRGYSSLTNTWTSLPAAGALGSPQAFASYALFSVGNDVIGFSADSPGFTTYSGTGAPTAFYRAPECAGFVESGLLVGYSPATGTFATRAITTGSPFIIAAENRFGCYVFMNDGGTLWAFSGVNGAWAAPVSGSFISTFSDAAIFARDTTGTGTSYAYSPFTNTWHAAPAVAILSVSILYQGCVLRHAGGFEGFSSRNGTWTSWVGTPGTTILHGSLFSSVSGSNAVIYDNILDRWVTVTGSASLVANAWRLTEILHDGTTAYGFALSSHFVDSIPTQGTVQEVRANSEIGFVLTDTHLYTYTSFGTFAPQFRFPEHARQQSRSASMRLTQLAQPGDFVTMAVADQFDYQDLPPYGKLFLNPASPVLFTVPLGFVPANGLLDVSFFVPNLPYLNGLKLHLQNIVQPTIGLPWFTSAIHPVIM